MDPDHGQIPQGVSKTHSFPPGPKNSYLIRALSLCDTTERNLNVMEFKMLRGILKGVMAGWIFNKLRQQFSRRRA